MDQALTILKDIGAIQEGHFLLSSGKHSPSYVQCARLFEKPEKASQIMAILAEKLKDVDYDLLCGPAIGGIIASYELARQVKKQSIFKERQDNQMTLRRGFKIEPGQKIIIVEDVITTGKSSMETKEVLEALGGEMVGIACVVNRTGKEEVGLPIYAATQLDVEVYDEKDLPDWLAEIPVEKPGSRKI